MYVIISIVDSLIGADDRSTGAGLLSGLFSLAVLIPSIAVSVRRLHGIDHTGWWILISLVPLVGQIVLLVFHIQDGTPGPNRFGTDPKSTKYRGTIAQS